MNSTLTVTHFLGIDPGVNTGAALWNAEERRFLFVTAFSFWEMVDEIYRKHVELLLAGKHLMAVIENPRAISAMYRGNYDDKEGRIRTSVAQDIGSNKRDCQLMVEFCKRNNVLHREITPGKHSGSKMKAEAFKSYTKWPERTNQHGRDAAMLVFGSTPDKIRHDVGRCALAQPPIPVVPYIPL